MQFGDNINMATEILFRIHVFFIDSHKNLRPDPSYIIEWLCNHGLNVTKADFDDSFNVIFKIKNEKEKTQKREILDKHLLAASLQNSMGFLITDCSKTLKYESWLAIPPNEQSFKKFFEACDDSNFLSFIKKLRSFYSQVEERQKIILGVSLLEELFDNKPEHILDKIEKKEVIDSIKKLKLNKQKKEKIINVLNDTSFMSAKTRNERMAEEISKYLHENKNVTFKRIKKIYKIRSSNAAHNSTEKNNEKELEKALREIDVIFEMFLIRKFKFVRLAGMQFM
jgi:ABC-type cobalamin/Fe3+-siderophores transport system ATPase subunit